MSNGVIHDKVTVLTSPIIFLGTQFIYQNITTSFIFSGAYIFSGLMFSGDLDIHSNQVKRWGVLKFIWKPYQKIFKHRSVHTHSPIWGTIIRGFYLYFTLLVFFLILMLVKVDIQEVKENYFKINFFLNKSYSLKEILINHFTLFLHNKKNIFYLFYGLSLGALSHTLTDSLSSLIKKNRKKKKRKKKP